MRSTHPHYVQRTKEEFYFQAMNSQLNLELLNVPGEGLKKIVGSFLKGVAWEPNNLGSFGVRTFKREDNGCEGYIILGNINDENTVLVPFFAPKDSLELRYTKPVLVRYHPAVECLVKFKEAKRKNKDLERRAR